MEVIEIISHFINRDNNVLSVEFRLNTDSSSELRSIGQDVLDVEYEDDEDEDTWLEDIDNEYIDEDILIQFLNEYYVVFPKKLPDAESE
jgi:hypothetical protein